MNPSTGVIIPSAGKGTRMGSGPAKQLLTIGGSTVLAHTVRRILKLPGIRQLIIPTSPDLVEETREIVGHCMDRMENHPGISFDVISGGATRFDSVGNGVKHLARSDVELVLVHDAVRPCFPLDATIEVLKSAFTDGAAILAIPSSDTVKLVDDQRIITDTPDRNTVWLAQTPQAFRKSLLMDACEHAGNAGFKGTDDASLLEFAGHPVRIIPGSRENIKITYRSDLFFAGQWLSSHDEIIK